MITRILMALAVGAVAGLVVDELHERGIRRPSVFESFERSFTQL